MVNATTTLMSKEHAEMSKALRLWSENKSNHSWFHNHAPCGTGKTHQTVDYIHSQGEDFVVVVPNFKMLYGKGNWIEKCKNRKIQYRVFLGKTQRVIFDVNEKFFDNFEVDYEKTNPDSVKMCQRDDGSEYVPGCGLCDMKNDCRYKQQYLGINDKKVIFCALENLQQFSGRNIIFDESIEQKKLKYINASVADLAIWNVHMDAPEEIVLNSEHNITMKIYNNVYVTTLKEKEYITDNAEYFFYMFLASVDKVYAWDNGRTITLFGELSHFLPAKDSYKRVIYNCATIDVDLLDHVMGTSDRPILTLGEGWTTYESKNFSMDKITNPVLKFSHSWTKSFAISNLEKFIRFLQEFFQKKTVLIVTKLSIENVFKNIPIEGDSPTDKILESVRLNVWGRIKKLNFNYEIVHFNSARGFNNAEGNYDAVFLYGRFGFDEATKQLWYKIGYTKDEVKKMEENEMYQALHRFRPFRHPEIPVFVMSDSKIFPDEDEIPFSYIDTFFSYYEKRYAEMTNKQLGEELGRSMNGEMCKKYKKLVSFMNDIIMRE